MIPHHSLSLDSFQHYFFARRKLARRNDFASIDLSLGRFRRVHISIATVGPHCTGALVCMVTYWWLTETPVPSYSMSGTKGHEGGDESGTDTGARPPGG